MSKTVVFIHGAWLTPESWKGVRAEFEARGYTTLAPAWPYMDRPIAELQQSPAPELKRLGITEIVDHYARIIAGMKEQPILVGHSFGGLIVQILLDRGYGVAGVAIDPAPPRGVLPGPTALKSAFPLLAKPLGWRRIHRMSEMTFRNTFGNGLPADQQRRFYAEQIVPSPGRIFFQAAFGIANGVKFKNPKRPPLMLIAGEIDKTVEPGMVRSNYKKARRAPSVTEFAEFPGRSHLLMVQPGWQEITGRILDWLAKVSPSVPKPAATQPNGIIRQLSEAELTSV